MTAVKLHSIIPMPQTVPQFIEVIGAGRSDLGRSKLCILLTTSLVSSLIFQLEV